MYEVVGKASGCWVIEGTGPGEVGTRPGEVGTEVVSGGPMAVGGIVINVVNVVDVVEGVVFAVWGAESDRVVADIVINQLFSVENIQRKEQDTHERWMSWLEMLNCSEH